MMMKLHNDNDTVAATPVLAANGNKQNQYHCCSVKAIQYSTILLQYSS